MGYLEKKYFYILICLILTNETLLLSVNKCFILFQLQPQIRKSWDSMENANKKRK